MKIDNVEIPPEDLEWFIKKISRWFNSVKESFYVPKNKRNRIGIVIALRTENEEDRERLRNDLVSELEFRLNGIGSDAKFKLVEFPTKLANKIKDIATARKYLALAKGHFILFGNASSKRKIGGKESYLFRLHGVVRHAPVDKLFQEHFSKEFGKLLPSRLSFPEDEEMIGFEIAQRWIGYVVNYIIAIAALVSGDLILAEQLLYQLEKELSTISDPTPIPVITELRGIIPNRIADLMVFFCTIHYNAFVKTRDTEHIFKMEPFLKKINELDPGNYSGRMYRAMFYFFNDEIKKAILEFKDIKSIGIAWRYSLGFLLAYEGDIDGALQNYRKLFYEDVGINVIDIEIFISEALEKKPEKIQLIFFLGLINYKIKKDSSLAKKYFNQFISEPKSSIDFPKLFGLAKKYLKVINGG